MQPLTQSLDPSAPNYMPPSERPYTLKELNQRCAVPGQSSFERSSESDAAPHEKRYAPDTGLTATLAERGARYGRFSTHATITQGLKDIMKGSPKWHALADDQREALEMIQHKIGRILNGNPDYADSWVDIAGYAKLVADRLSK